LFLGKPVQGKIEQGDQQSQSSHLLNTCMKLVSSLYLKRRNESDTFITLDRIELSPKTSKVFVKSLPLKYWVERKVLAFSKRWPFFEELSYM
jgi:hypothetical protein